MDVANVRVLNITTPEFTNEEYKMFWLGRVVAIHEIGEYKIVEYLDLECINGTINNKVTDEHMFHTLINGWSESYYTMDMALLGILCKKYRGPNTDAAMLFANALGMPIK